MSAQLQLVEGRISEALYIDLQALTAGLQKLQDLYLQQEGCMRDLVAAYNDTLRELVHYITETEGLRDAATGPEEDPKDLASAGASRPAEGTERGETLDRHFEDGAIDVPGRPLGAGDAAPLREESGRRVRSDHDPTG